MEWYEPPDAVVWACEECKREYPPVGMGIPPPQAMQVKSRSENGTFILIICPRCQTQMHPWRVVLDRTVETRLIDDLIQRVSYGSVGWATAAQRDMYERLKGVQQPQLVQEENTQYEGD